ncbi:MAG: carboxypeptidase-like regulatory domain-containing protein [Actinomycetota bacterium]
MTAETPVLITAGTDMDLGSISVPPGATISGHVTIPAGHPQDVDVSAHSSTLGVYGGGNGYTDAAGDYTVAGLWPADYVISFRDNAYPATLVSKEWGKPTDRGPALTHVTALQKVVNRNTTMEVGGALTGFITDSAGLPVQHVYVAISKSDGTVFAGSVITGTDGSYSFGTSFNPLLPGTYYLQVQNSQMTGTPSSNWASSWFGNTAFANGSTPIVVTAAQTTTVNMKLGLGGSIAGRVTDKNGSGAQALVTALGIDPSTGKSVVLGEQESDADGNYIVSHLPATKFELQFTTAEEGSDYGLANQYWPGVLEESDATRVPLAVGQSRTGYNIALPPLPISTHSPFGRFESASAAAGVVTATGWAIDPDVTYGAQVTVSLDGLDLGVGGDPEEAGWYAGDPTPVPPNKYAAYGTDHGFTVFASDVAPGKHLVCVTALNSGGPSTPDTPLGCQTVLVQTGSPVGAFEAAMGGPDGIATLTGWALDPDTFGRVQVQATVDGLKGGSFVANKQSSDIPAKYVGYGTNHGFVTGISGLTPGSHTVCLTVINRGPTATDTALGCKPVTVPGGKPFGSFDSATVQKNGSVAVSGWTLDPDTSSPITVRFTSDGTKLSEVVAGTLKPHLSAQFPGYGNWHGFTSTLSGLKSGPHVICAIALDTARNSDNTQLGCFPLRIPKS